jgi:hypothetical protein
MIILPECIYVGFKNLEFSVYQQHNNPISMKRKQTNKQTKNWTWQCVPVIPATVGSLN